MKKIFEMATLKKNANQWSMLKSFFGGNQDNPDFIRSYCNKNIPVQSVITVSNIFVSWIALMKDLLLYNIDWQEKKKNKKFYIWNKSLMRWWWPPHNRTSEMGVKGCNISIWTIVSFALLWADLQISNGHLRWNQVEPITTRQHYRSINIFSTICCFFIFQRSNSAKTRPIVPIDVESLHNGG